VLKYIPYNNLLGNDKK